MRKEFLMTNYQSIEEFMKDAAQWLRSIKFGEIISDGRNLQKELTEEEQTELSKYVYYLAYTEMEKDVRKYHYYRHADSYQDQEDFLHNALIILMEHLHKYNDRKHLKDSSKQYCFSTFLGNIIKWSKLHDNAQRNQLTDEQEKNRERILRAMIEISQEKGIEIDYITVEMVNEKLGTRYKKSTFEFLLNVSKTKLDIDEIPENELISSQDVFKESSFAKELTSEIQSILEEFTKRLSDLDKFFVLLKVLKDECYDNKNLKRDYSEMTDKQISVDKVFINLVRADENAQKNIRTCNVLIQRPQHCASKDVEDILLTNVENVNPRLIEYRKKKAEKLVSVLETKLTYSELEGQAALHFFKNQLEILLEEYR